MANPHNFYNPRRTTFHRHLFSIITASIIITGAVVVIIFLILRPHLPHFRVNSFSVTSPFNLTTTDRLTTSWNISLTAVNPNEKLTLYYHDIQATVFYGDEPLADEYFAPFVQGKKSQSEMMGSFVADEELVDYEDVDGMHEEMAKNNGTVGFNVMVVADVRFKAGIWSVKRLFLRVYCGNLVVKVEGNGSIVNGSIGGPRQCTVVYLILPRTKMNFPPLNFPPKSNKNVHQTISPTPYFPTSSLFRNSSMAARHRVKVRDTDLDGALVMLRKMQSNGMERLINQQTHHISRIPRNEYWQERLSSVSYALRIFPRKLKSILLNKVRGL